MRKKGVNHDHKNRWQSARAKTQQSCERETTSILAEDYGLVYGAG
jgi:hypothetical protein